MLCAYTCLMYTPVCVSTQQIHVSDSDMFVCIYYTNNTFISNPYTLWSHVYKELLSLDFSI